MFLNTCETFDYFLSVVPLTVNNEASINVSVGLKRQKIARET